MVAVLLRLALLPGGRSASRLLTLQAALLPDSLALILVSTLSAAGIRSRDILTAAALQHMREILEGLRFNREAAQPIGFLQPADICYPCSDSSPAFTHVGFHGQSCSVKVPERVCISCL